MHQKSHHVYFLHYQNIVILSLVRKMTPQFYILLQYGVQYMEFTGRRVPPPPGEKKIAPRIIPKTERQPLPSKLTPPAAVVEISTTTERPTTRTTTTTEPTTTTPASNLNQRISTGNEEPEKTSNAISEEQNIDFLDNESFFEEIFNNAQGLTPDYIDSDEVVEGFTPFSAEDEEKQEIRRVIEELKLRREQRRKAMRGGTKSVNRKRQGGSDNRDGDDNVQPLIVNRRDQILNQVNSNRLPNSAKRSVCIPNFGMQTLRAKSYIIN